MNSPSAPNPSTTPTTTPPPTPPDPVIAVTDIAWVRYRVPDLDRLAAFAADFGLSVAARTPQALYLRGAGTAPVLWVAEQGAEPATLGFGLQAAAADDLQRLAAHLGTGVDDNPEPGGGRRVCFTDPAGFQVAVLHGQTPLAPQPVRAVVPPNPHRDRRRLGQPVRLPPRPSTVTRLGHVALLVADFAATHAFYRDVLGLRDSDTYWAGAPHNTVAAFMHCGLGARWTDHHTLALVAAPDGLSRFDHAAFEVLDLDDLMLGHQHLLRQGGTHAWGVGRHVQGSQIFDYWRDPFGHKVEHWTDGDLVNHETPVGHAPLTPEGLSQWAPPLNPSFFV